MPKEDKRKLIIDSAFQVLEKHRYHEMKMDDIAVKAKVGKGTIYRYFSSKDELLQEMTNYAIDTQVQFAIKEKEKDSSIREKLINICNNFQNFLTKRPAVMKVMHEQVERVMAGITPEESKFEKHRPFYLVLKDIFGQAFESGELAPTQSLEFVVIAFKALVREFAIVKYFFPDRGYTAEGLVDFFLNSLKKG